MTFEEFLRHLSDNHVSLSLRDGALQVHGAPGALTEELKAQVEQYRRRLVKHLSAQGGGSDAAASGALSWFQERLWIHYCKDPGDLSYNIPVLLDIRGKLDVAALERSLALIVARHESLRSRYTTAADGTAVVTADPASAFRLEVVDGGAAPLDNAIVEVVEHHFDLSRGPVFIARLVALEPERHLLLLNVHHIAADAWSIQGVFFGELLRSYEAFSVGGKPSLPPLKTQYADFAAWQRRQDTSVGLEYWTEALAGYEDTVELPADRLRRADSGQSSGGFVYRYDSAFARRLERFSREHGCTVFMSLLAGLGLLISRYTGRTDLCVGTTASGRSRVELEPLIGFFINILPLRICVDEDISVGDYMAQVRSLTLSGFEHQMVPFEQVLHAGGFAKHAKQNPLVPVIIRHQNFPHTSIETPLPGGVVFGPYGGDGTSEEAGSPVGKGVAARCEIELSFTGTGDALEVEVAYASDLYERETVERLLGQHAHLLEQMFESGNTTLSALSCLRPSDRERLCRPESERMRALEGCSTFPERFSAQSRRTPQGLACFDAAGRWTFEDLEISSNQLAHCLTEAGVGKGDVVGVCLPRGPQLLISQLGIWKTGAAYVPLDPAYPSTYLHQILTDAEPRCVVTNRAQQEQLALEPQRCLTFEHLTQRMAVAPKHCPAVKVAREDLAYLMYTSGSTGLPKGVRVPHRQLVNWLAGIEERWPFEPGEVVAQKTTAAFAVSVKETFAGLLNGCALCYLADATVKDTAALVAALAEHRITRINLVPSHLRAVLEQLANRQRSLPELKTVITAGEPLTAEIVQACRASLPHVRLLNNYGCTELNDITYYDATDFDGQDGFVPIGKPIQNTRLYVLDRRGRLVPEGVAGELHVASASLSDGYHRLDELTQQRYLDNPFGDEPSTRLFNTGDVVRVLPDQNLDYVGRWDLQVKVRGFRVDVRHVEKVLGDYPGIGLRAVVGEAERLVAFYVAEAEADVELAPLRDFLRRRLPNYMVPDAFVALPEMPRLPNGKLNRRALRASGEQLQQSDAYAAPETDTERALATIWADVLEQPESNIGRQTHFFELGGHSLAATRVVARLKDRFGIETKLAAVFEGPLLHELAAVVDEQLAEGTGAIEQWSVPVEPEAESDASSRLLENKVALVTGASRGIGQAVALLLAKNGARVAINYRESERQAHAVKEQIEALGGSAMVVQADVTRGPEVERMVAEVRQALGPVDVLVANASIAFSKRAFVDYEWGVLEQKVSSELRAVFYPCQAVVGDMIDRQSGSIIAISSAVSKNATPGFVAQTTAKAALDAFVRSLAAELGEDGVRVNTVAPGITLTDAAANMPQQRKDAAAAICPMRRNGTPDDMAGAVLFLASDLSRFMTGAYLPVDGGFTML